jgi:hypothetical protein
MTAQPAFSVLRCLPAQIDQRFEYHWLEFTGQHRRKGQEKDIWRWHDDGWHSTLNNARFTPDQLYAQGWRYVVPCPPPLATARERAA